IPLRTHHHEFQAVDEFGWGYTLVAVREEFREEIDGVERTTLGPIGIHVAGGGGLIHHGPGRYEDPANKTRIRSDDPQAP
ncbi:MAG: hypothetical protein ACREP7_13220, partial [Lysobacter sp.]